MGDWLRSRVCKVTQDTFGLSAVTAVSMFVYSPGPDPNCAFISASHLTNLYKRALVTSAILAESCVSNTFAHFITPIPERFGGNGELSFFKCGEISFIKRVKNTTGE